MERDTPALTEARLDEIEREIQPWRHLDSVALVSCGTVRALLAAARRGLRADALAEGIEDHLFRGRPVLSLSNALSAYRSATSDDKPPRTQELAAQVLELRRTISQMAKANDELALNKITLDMWGAVSADIAEHLKEQET